MRALLIAAASLALSGCGLLSLAGGLMPASPAVVADKTELDERAALAVETAYATASTAGALAFRSGLIEPSRDVDVQRPNFCKLVLADLASVTDLGGRVAALDCRAHDAVQKVRRAYDAGNASSYAAAGAEAIGLLREFTNLLKGDGR